MPRSGPAPPHTGPGRWFWSEQLELDLEVAGYYTLISLPLSHGLRSWR